MSLHSRWPANDAIHARHSRNETPEDFSTPPNPSHTNRRKDFPTTPRQCGDYADAACRLSRGRDAGIFIAHSEGGADNLRRRNAADMARKVLEGNVANARQLETAAGVLSVILATGMLPPSASITAEVVESRLPMTNPT